jgi:Protein of unknown function (DUF3551)
MRILVLAILAIAAASVAEPVRAQTYDPNFPVCLQLFGRGGGYYDCRYTSLPQCNLSAWGRAAQCVINPFFANAEAPTGRPYRRHHRAS